MKKKESIVIEFVGGPKDGGQFILDKPYMPVLLFQSDLKGDIGHIYEFDEKISNNKEPFRFNFAGYKKID